MPDDEPSLAKRMEALRLREAGQSDETAVQRALEAKATLREALDDVLDAEPIPPEVEEAFEAEVPRGLSARLSEYRAEVAQVLSKQVVPERKRLLDWFLGRETQELGQGVVTPVTDLAEGWQELDFYEVDAPYAFVRIARKNATGEILYQAIEPPLDEKGTRVYRFVQEALIRGLQENPGRLTMAERREYLRDSVHQILRDYGIQITAIEQQRVEYYVMRDFLGLGRIHPLMMDPHIEDISCDGASVPVFTFHRQHEAVITNIQFEDDADVDGFVIRMAQRSGKAISVSDPILDAALPDGSRLQATLGREVTENGSTFTIRRFRPDPFSPADLLRFGTMSPEMLAWFWLIVENGHSLIFSGGTASGKTTSLNAICQFIPLGAKVVTIEDTREVNLPHENWIKAVTRSGTATEGSGEIGMFELLKAALRQRPEYILVGEVRGQEATVAFQAMATGHTVYSTMHADSARSVVYRLENKPIEVPRLVLQALDVVAIQTQVRSGGRRVRRIKEIVELVGMDPMTRELLTNRVFEWQAAPDTFTFAPKSYMLDRIAAERNWGPERMREEFGRRVTMLRRWADDKGMDLSAISKAIQAYERNPDETFAAFEADFRA